MTDETTETTTIEVVTDEELEDAAFLAQLQRARLTTPLTRVLLVLLVLGAGFLAGAWTQGYRGDDGGGGGLPDGAPAQLAALLAGGRGGNGAALPGATGGAVIGTVKLVDGTNVYIEDAQGNVTKIKTTDDTTVQVTEDGTVHDLGPTKTVRVEGTQNDDGTYTATAISETASGGGFGGPGGGGFGGTAPDAGGG